MLLVIASGGVFFLEQPGSSLLPRHDRFRWMLRVLQEREMRVARKSERQLSGWCFSVGHMLGVRCSSSASS